MIRPMTEADIPRAADIHVFARRWAYRGSVSDQVLFGEMLVPQSVEKLAKVLADETAKNYVYDDGIIKGFMTFGPCHDEDKFDAQELWYIYIDPFMQRQGIGSKLITLFEEEVRQNCKIVCLRTLERNDTARVFYEKNGYAPDGMKHFVSDGWGYQMRYTKIL